MRKEKEMIGLKGEWEIVEERENGRQKREERKVPKKEVREE